MPFGLKVAPEIFQRKLNDAIADLPGVFSVADDILVAGEGATYQQAVDDHDKKLEALLIRCRQRGICLNKDKLNYA